MPSKPNPWPLKKLPSSKTKTSCGINLLRLSFLNGLNLFLLPNTTHELKAFTIKHDFAQHMKKVLSRQDGIFFSFEEIYLVQ